MARHKGLVKSRSGSVQPSPATLIRVAFHFRVHLNGVLKNGTPEGTRTPDLLLRRQLLYPAELLAHLLERVTGIGPAYPAWKAGVLPLNYTRKSLCLSDSAIGF